MLEQQYLVKMLSEIFTFKTILKECLAFLSKYDFTKHLGNEFLTASKFEVFSRIHSNASPIIITAKVVRQTINDCPIGEIFTMTIFPNCSINNVLIPKRKKRLKFYM